MPAVPVKQRIPVNATSDANGNITFTFPVVSQGSTLVGSVLIANVSPMAQFVGAVGGTNVSNWSGGSTYGQIPIPGGEQLVVTGTNLAASKAFQAVIVGYLYPTAEVPALLPAALSVSAPPTSNQQGSNSQTSAASGTATFNLGTVPAGVAWVGTVAVPTAPPSAQFVLSVGGTAIAYFQGPNTSQQFQALGGQSISVAATGLAPSTSYTAVFNGYAVPEEQAPNVFPGPTAFGVPAGLNTASKSLLAAGNTAILTASSGTAQYLLVAASVTCSPLPATVPVILLAYISIDTPVGTNGIIYTVSPGQVANQYGPAGNNASSFGTGIVTPPGKNVYLEATPGVLGTLTSIVAAGTIVYAQIAA